MPIDLNTLATQLTSLSNDDAATLLDAINGLTERAQKAREERTRAEAERDAHALTCGCGKPVAHYRWLECVQQGVRLGTHRRNPSAPLRGGYIGDGGSWDGGHIPSENPVFKTTWFTCDDRDCDQWVEVAHDKSPIVGWE